MPDDALPALDRALALAAVAAGTRRYFDARRGRVDGFETQQLVAAGLTLLRRSAPLVRALAGGRAALLLPTTPAFVTALAASEGRGAVLVNPLAAPPEIAHQLADAGVKGTPELVDGLLDEAYDHAHRVDLEREQLALLEESGLPIVILPALSEGVDSGSIRELADLLWDGLIEEGLVQ